MPTDAADAGYYGLQYDHCFAALSDPQQPNLFCTRMSPEGVGLSPQLLAFNPAVAEMIGLDQQAVNDPHFVDIFCGNKALPGGLPLAMAYSGHQFGYWAGQLGDGRALLLAQLRDRDNALWDIQLKGSGITPYSRMGDGRAVLRSCVREYLASIALHGLGIPTSHALCLIASGETVQRETNEPGAVLTRIAQSHVRFGHFEHFCHHGQHQALLKLMQHVLEQYFPGCSPLDYYAEICRRTACLIADWQAYGFAHGVMNTDNMSAIGLTIDYGPYGFLDQFDMGFVCNHSDDLGRYRFDRQWEIGRWNLSALANALTPIIPLEETNTILAQYPRIFQERYHQRMCARLGLPASVPSEVWQQWLVLLQETQADYNLSFWVLHDAFQQPDNPAALLLQSTALEWYERYCALVLQHGGIATVCKTMCQHNPRYILRNWLAEKAIRGLHIGDDKFFTRLVTVLSSPFRLHPDSDDLQHPPPPELQGIAVSCSS